MLSQEHGNIETVRVPGDTAGLSSSFLDLPSVAFLGFSTNVILDHRWSRRVPLLACPAVLLAALSAGAQSAERDAVLRVRKA